MTYSTANEVLKWGLYKAKRRLTQSCPLQTAQVAPAASCRAPMLSPFPLKAASTIEQGPWLSHVTKYAIETGIARITVCCSFLWLICRFWQVAARCCELGNHVSAFSAHCLQPWNSCWTRYEYSRTLTGWWFSYRTVYLCITRDLNRRLLQVSEKQLQSTTATAWSYHSLHREISAGSVTSEWDEWKLHDGRCVMTDCIVLYLNCSISLITRSGSAYAGNRIWASHWLHRSTHVRLLSQQASAWLRRAEADLAIRSQRLRSGKSPVPAIALTDALIEGEHSDPAADSMPYTAPDQGAPFGALPSHSRLIRIYASHLCASSKPFRSQGIM